MSKFKDVLDIIAKYAPKLSEDSEERQEALSVEGMTSGTLADGTEIYTDAEEWALGVAVFREEGGEAIPVADGEYGLSNGQVIVVSGGSIESVAPAESVEAEKQDKEKEVEASAEESTEKLTEAKLSAQEREEIVQAIVAAFDTKLEAVKVELSEQIKAKDADIEKLKLAAVSRPPRGKVAEVKAPLDLSKLNPYERSLAIMQQYQ